MGQNPYAPPSLLYKYECFCVILTVHRKNQQNAQFLL